MKKTLQIILLFLLPFILQGQTIPQNPNKTDKNGLKQGKWTILYDATWKVIKDTNKAEFYRTITYLDNKAVGKVTDWYKNGKPQMIADSLISESPEKYEGNLTFYRKDGSKEKMQVFENGKGISQTFYNVDGSIIENDWIDLFNKGRSLDQIGNHRESVKCYQKAQKKIEQIYGKKYKGYTTILNALALSYRSQALYDKAIPLLKEALEINKELLGEKSVDYATTMNNLGLIYVLKGLYDEAEPLLKKTISIIKDISGTKHPIYSTALNILASLYREKGLYPKSEELFKQVIKVRKEVFGEKHPDYARALSNLGLLYTSQGIYIKADSLYRKSLKIRKEVLGEKHPEYLESTHNLANSYLKQGLYIKAENLLKQVIKIRKEISGEKHPEYVKSLNSLAITYSDQGLYAKATPLMLKALDIRKEVLGEKHPSYALYLRNVAVIYGYQGLYKQAFNLLKKSLKIYKETVGENNPNYTITLGNLAEYYHNIGLTSKAESLLKEILKILKTNLGEKHPEYAFFLNNLGSLYSEQKKFIKAEDLFQEALNIKAEVFGKTHPEYAITLANLGSLYSNQNMYIKAESLYQEALKIFKKYSGDSSPSYSVTLARLALLYAKRQKLYTKVKPLFQKVITNKLKQIDVLLPSMSDFNRRQYIQSINVSFKNFYYFTNVYYSENPTISNDLLNLRLQIKGLIFQSFQKMQKQILASGDSTLITKYNTWKDKRSYLAKVYEMSIEKKQKQKIDESKLEEETEKLEKELSLEAERFSGLEELQKFNQKYTWQDAQKYLKNNEILIEIVRVQVAKDTMKYIAIILNNQMQKYPKMLVLENGLDLEQKHIEFYRQNIDNQKTDTQSYTAFWAKIDSVISKQGKIKKIYFSPDGIYNQINLLTLKNPKTNQYLIDKYEIQILGTPKDLILKAEKTKTHKKLKDYDLALFGYALYSPFPKKEKKSNSTSSESLILKSKNRLDLDSTQRLFDGKKIRLLLGTKKEVENIAQIAHNKNIKAKTYIRREANEENIKKLKNPDILHIATHGYFLADISTENRDNFGKIEPKKFRENPLLRSGLLLAGAEANFKDSIQIEREENGILTAEEALTLDLDKTELVVLSACETGLGEISNGEGVYGLQRAFQQAGAKTILMSLWNVSDKVTQEMMTLFYENLLKKKQNKRTAFKNAQNQIKKKYPEPYYWGAFVMIGE